VRTIFGSVEAENVMRTANDGTEVEVLVPARGTNTGSATVNVFIVNGVGTSNALPFDYIVGGAPPVRFHPMTLRHPDGRSYSLGQGVKSSARGPDGRYYFGSQGGVIHVRTVDEAAGVVTVACATAALPGGRTILGLSFPPSDVAASRLHVSTTVLFCLDRGLLPYASGWRNGRVVAQWQRAVRCWLPRRSRSVRSWALYRSSGGVLVLSGSPGARVTCVRGLPPERNAAGPAVKAVLPSLQGALPVLPHHAGERSMAPAARSARTHAQPPVAASAAPAAGRGGRRRLARCVSHPPPTLKVATGARPSPAGCRSATERAARRVMAVGT